LKSCGLKLKNEAILDHFLDHIKKKTCRDKPRYSKKWLLHAKSDFKRNPLNKIKTEIIRDK